MFRVSIFSTWLLCAAFSVPLNAQTTLDNPIGEYMDYPAEIIGPSRANEAAAELVSVNGAAWIRVYFSDVFLAAGSVVRITSLADGEQQTLDAAGMAMWSDSSAYFNGDAVLVELISASGGAGERLSIGRVAFEAASFSHRGDPSQCGICVTDDRTASNEDWAGRLVPPGCTAEVYNRGSCVMSAGHCIQPNAVVQFRVPLSNPNCSSNHPPVADQFPVIDVLSRNNGVGDDWAVLKTGENNLGQRIFDRYGRFKPLASGPSSVGDPVELFGYGLDLTCVVSATQRRSEGQITFRGSSWYEFNADVRGGNSGSGFVEDDRLIGVVTHCSFGCPNYATRIDVPQFADALSNFCPGCDTDLNGDGTIDLTDLSIALSSYGCSTPPCVGDVDGDGDTDLEDLGQVLAAMGSLCD